MDETLQTFGKEINLGSKIYLTKDYNQCIENFKKEINTQNIIIGLQNYDTDNENQEYEEYKQMTALFILHNAMTSAIETKKKRMKIM